MASPVASPGFTGASTLGCFARKSECNMSTSRELLTHQPNRLKILYTHTQRPSTETKYLVLGVFGGWNGSLVVWPGPHMRSP
jgi:hypothetical protein